eukprot:gb/GECG01012502.1/.p1 GENE.gb/GECG01012502.1/~~gb/GECG01012502.1/.p1  ORF type:complete len:644 (+),score=48.66 gb/GECG01012502.1/:1-1932(+)
MTEAKSPPKEQHTSYTRRAEEGSSPQVWTCDRQLLPRSPNEKESSLELICGPNNTWKTQILSETAGFCRVRNLARTQALGMPELRRDGNYGYAHFVDFFDGNPHESVEPRQESRSIDCVDGFPRINACYGERLERIINGEGHSGRPSHPLLNEITHSGEGNASKQNVPLLSWLKQSFQSVFDMDIMLMVTPETAQYPCYEFLVFDNINDDHVLYKAVSSDPHTSKLRNATTPLAAHGLGVRSIVTLLLFLSLRCPLLSDGTDDPNGVILAIDEPEAHLNSLQAERFAALLLSLFSRVKMRLYIVSHQVSMFRGLMTHLLSRRIPSSGTTFGLRAANVRISRCSRTSDGYPKVNSVSFDKIPIRDPATPLLSPLLEGLFRELVVLAENPTDALIFRYMYLKLKEFHSHLKDCDARCGLNVDFPPADPLFLGFGGLGNLVELLDLLRSLGVDAYMWVDVDFCMPGNGGAPLTKMMSLFGCNIDTSDVRFDGNTRDILKDNGIEATQSENETQDDIAIARESLAEVLVRCFENLPISVIPFGEIESLLPPAALRRRKRKASSSHAISEVAKYASNDWVRFYAQHRQMYQSNSQNIEWFYPDPLRCNQDCNHHQNLDDLPEPSGDSGINPYAARTMAFLLRAIAKLT